MTATPNNSHAALHCYAGWSQEPLEGCSSGGAAFLLSAHWIQDLDGIVYASAFIPDEKTVSVCRITTLEGLRATRGSKYVRGRFPAETFRLLKADLEAGRNVLFIGTPCQVDGIRKRLVHKPSNLILADLLCHGMPPASSLREEVRYLTGDRPVTDVRFRDGARGDFHLSIWNKDECLYSVKAQKQPYVLAMLQGVTLMEGCYQCPFASPKRTGDITFGDYIALGKEVEVPEGRRISYISVNSEEGAACYGHFLQLHPDFHAIERPVSERLGYAPSILKPTRRHPLRDRFLERLPRLGFAKAVRRTMRGEMLRQSPFYKRLHHLAHRLKQLFQ